MNKCTLFFTCLMTLLLYCSSLFAQEIDDSKGRDFWVTFNQNFEVGSETLSLFITGESETNGTVNVPGLGFSESFSVTPGVVTTVEIPAGAMLTQSDGIEDKGVNISANDEVTVYGLNRESFTTDAFLALPVDALGTEYIMKAYFSLGFSNNASQIGIVATEDNTSVTIIPSTTAGSRTANVPYDIVLDKGQAYQLKATNTNSDLTGTIINSDKPIATFGGHTCANVPTDERACDHLVEQIPPASTFGQRFVTAPLATRTGGDIFRVLASEDNTRVDINGVNGFSASFTLNRGEFEELDIPSNEYTTINATGPVLVAQYSKGQTSDNTNSDPFMLLIPPFEQFLSSYTITTPATGFATNYVNVVAPNSAVGNVTLDGTIIEPSEFTNIGTSGFSGAQIPIELGTHNLNSTFPFGLFVYGFDNFDSYGYVGGQAFGEVALVTELALTPETGSANTGEEFCLTATVTDGENRPISGVRVDFSVSGANTADGFAVTNADGEAVFCYTPANVGTDNAIASLGDNVDNSTIFVEESFALTCATWDGTQWINGVEPDATLCAVIESGTLMTDKGYTSLSLEVKPGARLVVTSGNFWDVKEDVIVDVTGELTVESGGTFLSYEGFDFIGEMNYIRNTSFTDGRYSVMSTPVQTATISDIGGFAYRFDEPSGTYQNYSGAMEVGTGYFAYCNNTVSFQGMPNVGDYSLTLPSDNSGFNVVGNPYTAAIDADAFLDANANNVMSTIWLWNNNGSRGYLTYNELGTVGGNTDGTDFDGAIGAAQGFFVMVNPGADVLFTESMRLTGRNQDNTYLRELNAEKEIEKHTLKVALSGNESSDETLIGFTAEATEGWDERFDAVKILASPFTEESRISVFSQLDEEPMAIQGLAKLNKVFNTVVVDLGADIPVRGNYTLSIDEMDLPEWASVLLEDTETGTLHDLVKKGYEFEASQGMEKNRFKLWIGEVEEGNHLAEIRMHGKSNMLTIWPSASGDEAKVNVYNLQGQQVNAGNISQVSHKFDMYIPGAGIYVVSMKTAEGMHIQKVMVQP